MSTELARQDPGALVAHGPGRPLGMKVAPELRLSLGYQDPERNNAPVKTDYFVVRNAEEVPDLAAKFLEQFGEKPARLPIMLPSTLEQAIDIRHVAFAGGGTDGGGVLKAIGRRNFATVGTLGGPDILTVWADKPEPEEVPIGGVDDARAQALGVELRMTFRFMLPQVVGVGGFVCVDSKGKQSIDSLWQKLVELYGIFGPRVTYAVQPELKLRKASSRYFDRKANSGRGKWRTSNFFALDLVVPESFDEMFARLQERDALLSGRERAALPPSESAEPDALGGAAGAAERPRSSDGAPSPAPSPQGAPAATSPGREGDPEQTSLLGEGPTQAQRDKLAKVFTDLKQAGGRPPDLEIADDTNLGFDDNEEPWAAYAKAFCEHVLDVEGERPSERLTAAQMEQLVEHLNSLVIPF